MILQRRPDRGSLLLTMAALIVVLGVTCGTVLLRSMDVYHASALAEKRLRARAAAEGAIVLIETDPAADHAPVRIGSCTVHCSPGTDAGDKVMVGLTVHEGTEGEEPALTMRYRARFETVGGAWRLISLEKAL